MTINTDGQVWSFQVWGAYVGAARRHVHIGTVPFRPPSDHRPGGRQARQARIPQIGLYLMQP